MVEQLPRTSIDPARHAAIDAQLKTLKLCARKLQAALSLQATELQILQRLYYKNKNQHRGALFWRSVSEMRRLMEKMEKRDLLGSITALRVRFYDKAQVQNINSVKGSWTHCPNPDYVSKYLLSCTESLKLAETTVERSLNAYESLQSAAFLHVLLLFVAISSRMRSVAMEIQEALVEIITSSRAILSAINTKPSQTDVTKLVSPVGEPMDIDKINVESELQSEPSASMEDEPLQEIVLQATIVASEHTTLPVVIPPPPVPIEREMSLRNKETTRSKDGSTTSMTKKKKKRRAKNEIDDIFGF